MAHKLKTKAGRALYALRKQTVEPVFGIIKSVLGFRQFSLRGLKKVTGEWMLVCLAWDLKRMAVLRPQWRKQGEIMRLQPKFAEFQPCKLNSFDLIASRPTGC